MTLIARDRLRSIQPERVGRTRTVRWIQVGIVVQQRESVAVHRWCAAPRVKRRLSCGVGGIGICSKVVIEGNVLLGEDHEVFDRSGGWSIVRVDARKLRF